MNEINIQNKKQNITNVLNKTDGYIIENKYFVFKNNLAKFLLEHEKQSPQLQKLSITSSSLLMKEDRFMQFARGYTSNKKTMFWNDYYVDEYLHPLNELNYLFSYLLRCFLHSFTEDEIDYVSLNYENNFLLNEAIDYFYKRVQQAAPILESLYIDFEEYEEAVNSDRNQGVDLYGKKVSEIHLLKFVDPEKYNIHFLNWFFKDFKSTNGFTISFNHNNFGKSIIKTKIENK